MFESTTFFFPETALVYWYVSGESETFWIRSSEWKFLNRLWTRNSVDTKSVFFFLSCDVTRSSRVLYRQEEEDGRALVCDKRDKAISYVFCRDLHLTSMFSGLLQKDLFKGKWSLAKNYCKQNYCHACHTRFAVFFPLPSCCVSSLDSRRQPCLHLSPVKTFECRGPLNA